MALHQEIAGASGNTVLSTRVAGDFVETFFGAYASSARVAGVDLADPDANGKTKALFVNLRWLAPEHVLFGHHDDLAYGFTWRGEEGRSDVKKVTGAYPGVYGRDVSRLFTSRQPDRRHRLVEPRHGARGPLRGAGGINRPRSQHGRDPPHRGRQRLHRGRRASGLRPGTPA